MAQNNSHNSEKAEIVEKSITWDIFLVLLIISGYTIYITFFARTEFFIFIRNITYSFFLMFLPIQITLLLLIRYFCAFSKKIYGRHLSDILNIIPVSLFFCIIMTSVFMTIYQWYFLLLSILFSLIIVFFPAYKNKGDKRAKSSGFGTILIVGIIIFLLPNTTMIPKKKWPLTSGTITSTAFIKTRYMKISYDKYVSVKYKYTVNGKNYFGSGVLIDKRFQQTKYEKKADEREKSLELLREYGPGNQLDIHYHPLFPGQSSLAYETGVKAIFRKWLYSFTDSYE